MNTDTETVEQMQDVVAHIDETMESVAEVEIAEEQREEEKVPLAALQKERKKRQDWEQRAKLYEEREAQQLRSQPQVAQQEEEDQYEALTKAEYKTGKQEITRSVMEAIWAKEHPEKVQDVSDNLKEFLNSRPHLKLAIEAAPNRYEEAYVLMNALSPKQKAALKVPAAVKKTAPGSPNAVPKAAGMNQAVDVMSMTDPEYKAWRASKRKAR